MNRFAILFSVVAMFASTHQLPAPILEPTPEATTAKPQTPPAKHKSSEASDSSAQRFNGTWKGTSTVNPAGASFTYSTTVIIKDGKTVDTTGEVRGTLQNPQGWNDLPEEYKHLSPLHYKYTNHSDHLVTDGAELVVRWAGRRLVDWGPKQLPIKYFEQWLKQNEPSAAAFTLKGDELVVGTGDAKFVYHRVK